MKILAIDFGTKRMGFAVGRAGSHLVIPLGNKPQRNNKDILAEIKVLVCEHEIDQIVIGKPVNMDGTACATGEKAEAFIQFLKRKMAIPIFSVDERLSSWEAEESLKHSYPDFRKRKRMVDGVAASLILKRYLEEHETAR